MKTIHWVGLVLACVSALAPVLAPELPAKVAVLVPSVLAVVAILKHAADAAEKDPQEVTK